MGQVVVSFPLFQPVACMGGTAGALTLYPKCFMWSTVSKPSPLPSRYRSRTAVNPPRIYAAPLRYQYLPCPPYPPTTLSTLASSVSSPLPPSSLPWGRGRRGGGGGGGGAGGAALPSAPPPPSPFLSFTPSSLPPSFPPPRAVTISMTRSSTVLKDRKLTTQLDKLTQVIYSSKVSIPLFHSVDVSLVSIWPRFQGNIASYIRAMECKSAPRPSTERYLFVVWMNYPITPSSGFSRQ